jgi:hypothetical protein
VEGDQEQQNDKPKSYGKRPAWQWVVIYLIIAIVVYGLVYLLFFRGNGSGGSTGGY